MLLYFNDLSVVFFFFFFQAEDGIRDLTVTGVQTCALPISDLWAGAAGLRGPAPGEFRATDANCLEIDRKSTRLNSSHSQISYAVFCLKKKKKKNNTISQYKTLMTDSNLYTQQQDRAMSTPY